MKNKYFDKKQNKKDRPKFVKLWSNYVLTHPGEEWSRQQNILINSQLQSAREHKWTIEEYKAMVGERF